MNSLSHTSHQSSNPSTDRFCPARASLECAIEQMQICMNKFPVISRQMAEAAAPSAATRKTTPKRAKKAKDASTKQKRSKKQNSDEEIEVAVAPDATPAAASGVVQSPPRVDLDRNATQMRALLSLRPSSVVAASASSYTPLHEPSSGTPASAPSQSSAAHAQQPAALGASAPSSQASGISAAAPFVAPHSQLGAASQASVSIHSAHPSATTLYRSAISIRPNTSLRRTLATGTAGPQSWSVAASSRGCKSLACAG